MGEKAAFLAFHIMKVRTLRKGLEADGGKDECEGVDE